MGTQISHGNAGLMKRRAIVDMPEIETDSAVSDGAGLRSMSDQTVARPAASRRTRMTRCGNQDQGVVRASALP